MCIHTPMTLAGGHHLFIVIVLHMIKQYLLEPGIAKEKRR